MQHQVVRVQFHNKDVVPELGVFWGSTKLLACLRPGQSCLMDTFIGHSWLCRPIGTGAPKSRSVRYEPASFNATLEGAALRGRVPADPRTSSHAHKCVVTAAMVYPANPAAAAPPTEVAVKRSPGGRPLGFSYRPEGPPKGLLPAAIVPETTVGRARLRVEAVVPDGAAAAAGLAVGDEILGVNGVSVFETGLEPPRPHAAGARAPPDGLSALALAALATAKRVVLLVHRPLSAAALAAAANFVPADAEAREARALPYYLLPTTVKKSEMAEARMTRGKIAAEAAAEAAGEPEPPGGSGFGDPHRPPRGSLASKRVRSPSPEEDRHPYQRRRQSEEPVDGARLRRRTEIFTILPEAPRPKATPSSASASAAGAAGAAAASASAASSSSAAASAASASLSATATAFLAAGKPTGKPLKAKSKHKPGGTPKGDGDEATASLWPKMGKDCSACGARIGNASRKCKFCNAEQDKKGTALKSKRSKDRGAAAADRQQRERAAAAAAANWRGGGGGGGNER